MYVHTRERDSRPGFDGVKIKLLLLLQSAYRQKCNTKTALLCVHDSVIRSIDERKGVILLLMDRGAAFDTIDHAILLNTSSNTIGINDRCFS